MRLWFVLFLFILFLCFVSRAYCQVSPPLRPTEEDLSCRYSPDTVLAWYNGQTTTQAQRMMMESSLTGVYVPAAFRFARTVPTCWKTIGKRFTRYSKILAVFMPERENEALFQQRGKWFIPSYGRHYGGESTILQAIRHCATATIAAQKECASSSQLTPGMKALLDLRVDNGRCVVGNPDMVVTPHTGPVTPLRNQLGLVQVGPRPPLTANQLAKLEATDAAHHATAEYKCGGPSTTLSVKQSHLDFEATATNEEELTFFQMKAFSGYEDSIVNGNPQGWIPSEICKLSRLTHTFHHAWSEAVKAGDWARAREADNAHQNAHIIMNLKDDRYRVKFPCPAWSGANIGQCPSETGPQIVARLP